MDRPRRDSRQHNGITLQGLLKRLLQQNLPSAEKPTPRWPRVPTKSGNLIESFYDVSASAARQDGAGHREHQPRALCARLEPSGAGEGGHRLIRRIVLPGALPSGQGRRYRLEVDTRIVK
jgi:hypothetical protein